MNVPLAEVLDRYSIELRKAYYGHGNLDLLRDLEAEIKLQLGSGILRAVGTTMLETDKAFAIVKGAVLLGLRNADIANLEWQIRVGQNLLLEELGRRALAIRKINDGRTEAKQNISKALNENVETRHYGYTRDLGSLTFDIQEPAVPPLSEKGKTDGIALLRQFTTRDGGEGS